MSESPDPFEAELAALRPHAPSPQLRQRVAQRLTEPSTAYRPWLWRTALASGLAAACLAAVLLWNKLTSVEPKPILVQPRPAPPEVIEDMGPTLLAYTRALARSPEDLEALLDRHAVSDSAANSEPVPFGVFLRSTAELEALLGDD